MNDDLLLSSYSYHLPPENIAQSPADQRDHSRLLVLNRRTGQREHRQFRDLPTLMAPGDLLVVNDTKVFHARLLGHKKTGGKVELFLLDFPQTTGMPPGQARTTGLLKASKRPKPGAEFSFHPKLRCRLESELGGGKVSVLLFYEEKTGLTQCLEEAGELPLPPYIERPEGATSIDEERYQTVFAAKAGAVAAPTAGLHFTDEIFASLAKRQVAVARITLHVGYGTFAPVREEEITKHQIHREYLVIDEATAAKVNQAKAAGKKIWAVGTTSVRSLEFSASDTGLCQAMEGWCDLYIYPGFEFKVVDNLITNFHLPNSSLMFLVSALCGRTTLIDCYQQAIRDGYRFFSYGDAMALMTNHSWEKREK